MKNFNRASGLFFLIVPILLLVVLLVPSYANAQEVDTGSGSTVDMDLVLPELFAPRPDPIGNKNLNGGDGNFNLNFNGGGGNHNLNFNGREHVRVTLNASPSTTVSVGQTVTFTANIANELCKDTNTNIVTFGPGMQYYNSWDFGDGSEIEYLGCSKTHIFTQPGEYEVYFQYSTATHLGEDAILIKVVQGGGGGGGMLPEQLKAYSEEKIEHFPPQIEQLHNAANSREVTFRITNEDGIDASSIKALLNDRNVEFTLQEIEKGYVVTIALPSDPTIKEFYIAVSAQSKNSSDSNYKEMRILIPNALYSLSAELESLKPPEQSVVVITPVIPQQAEVKAVTYAPKQESKKVVMQTEKVKKVIAKKHYTKPIAKKVVVTKKVTSQPTIRTILYNLYNRLVKPLLSSRIARFKI